MKKTVNINVAGFPFTIDQDAYDMLDKYLVTLEQAFGNSGEATEIVSDIESRIAELLIELKEDGHEIITLADVKQVIQRVGQPEEMIEETVHVHNADGGAGQAVNVEIDNNYIDPAPEADMPKKLYRDPEDGILCGVCAGLAWYLGVDVTWVRIAVVLLTFASLSTMALAYFIAAVIIPPAVTPYERMRMMGRKGTVGNIGRTVTGEYAGCRPNEGRDWVDRNCSPHVAKARNGILPALGKVLVVLGLIVSIPVLVGLIIGFLGCLFAIVMSLVAYWSATPFNLWGQAVMYQQEVVYGCLIGLGAMLFLGIPLWIFVRMLMRPDAKPYSLSTRWTLGILMLVGFLTAAVFTGIISNM